MQDIPGLDPDGRLPGGFTLAGRADVGELFVAGQQVFRGVRTNIVKSTPQTVLAGHDDPAVFDTVLDDPSHTADLANGGVTIAKSGIYLVVHTTAIDNTGGTTSALQITPYLSPNGGDNIIGSYLKFPAPATDGDTISYFYLVWNVVDRPHTMKLDIDNETDADVILTGSQMSVVQLG